MSIQVRMDLTVLKYIIIRHVAKGGPGGPDLPPPKIFPKHLNVHMNFSFLKQQFGIMRLKLIVLDLEKHEAINSVII